MKNSPLLLLLWVFSCVDLAEPPADLVLLQLGWLNLGLNRRSGVPIQKVRLEPYRDGHQRLAVPKGKLTPAGGHTGSVPPPVETGTAAPGSG